MYNTLATMRQDLMGFVPGFSPSVYTSAIQRAYDDLARAYPWQELETEVAIATKQYVDTGGAKFTNGSTSVTAATTVSAAWSGGEANGFAGYYIVKRDDAWPSIITSSDSVSVTLTSGYLGRTTTAAASAGDGYAIFKHIYAITAALSEVTAIVCEDNLLGEAHDHYIDKHDGDYQSDGEPDKWRQIGRDSAGYTLVQIYPALIDDIYVLRIRGRKPIETLGETAKPLLDSSLIIAFAEVELLKRKRILDPNSVTDSIIEASIANAANHFNYATERDRRVRTDEPYTRDNMFGETHRGQDWLVSHDPWDD